MRVRMQWSHGATVLLLLVCVYILNQADRQLLPILISAGLKCGNASSSSSSPHGGSDSNAASYHGVLGSASHLPSCLHFSDLMEGLIKGPAFTVVYTVFGVSLSYVADNYRRTYVLATAIGIWSLATCLCYVVKTFYQLVILRVILGIGEAVCNPVAYSLIADCFAPKSRAFALSVYHLGVYIGNALGYVAASANATLGWRLTFIIFGAPGFLFALLLAVGVQEPRRGASEADSSSTQPVQRRPKSYNLISLFRHMKGTPAFYTIVAASSIRQIAGFSLGAYLPSFFKDTFHLSKQGYNHTMLMVGMIVLVCGSLGAILGGYLSDALMRRSSGAKAQVVAISQLLATPFIVGVLFSPHRAVALGVLAPAFVTAETWLGSAAAIVQDVTAPQLRAQSSAVYMSINTLVGGCGPLIIGALVDANVRIAHLDEVQTALLLVVPTAYIVSAVLFLGVAAALKRQHAPASGPQQPLIVNKRQHEA